MADVKKDKTLEESKKLMTEKAIFNAPRNTISDEEVFVCINGHPMRLKRGVDVEIPKAFAKVLDQSRKQKEYALEYSAKTSENVDKI